jgi:hypothetical protein
MEARPVPHVRRLKLRARALLELHHKAPGRHWLRKNYRFTSAAGSGRRPTRPLTPKYAKHRQRRRLIPTDLPLSETRRHFGQVAQPRCRLVDVACVISRATASATQRFPFFSAR